MRSFWIWVARKLHAAAIADLERQDAMEALKQGHAARLQAGKELLKELHQPSKAIKEDFREVLVRIKLDDYNLIMTHLCDVAGFVDNCVDHAMLEVRQAILHEADTHDRR